MRASDLFWKLTRYARAARFWLLLALAVLGWVGFGQAHAQTDPYAECYSRTNAGTSSGPLCPSRQAAYEQAKLTCEARTIDTGSIKACAFFTVSEPGKYVVFRDVVFNGHTTTRTWAIECPSGSGWDANTKTCACPAGQIKNDITGQCMQSCSSRPTPPFQPVTGRMIPNGSIGCGGGCLYAVHSNGDGTFSQTYLGDGVAFHCSVTPGNCADNGPGYTMNYALNMCVPPQIECAENQVKDPYSGECTDGCPLGQVLDSNGQCKIKENTCPAGQIKGPDGSCVQDSCPAGQTKGADGTCKKDGDNDKDEGDDDKYFSGGDNCSAPPQCSGDPILCGQARIQWRIDCNTRRNVNISGGSCAAIPICTGEKCDAMEYAQLLQQWRTTCALEKLADGASGVGDGEGIQGDPDFDADADGRAAVDRLGDGGVSPSDAFSDGSANNGGQGGTPGGDGELDTAGLGLPRSCPNLPSVNVLGTTLDFNQAGGVMCNWISIGGYFVLVLAAFASVRILASGSSV